MVVEKLRKRVDFQHMTLHGALIHKQSLLMQYFLRRNHSMANSPIRVGFTASRRVGNAVMRNLAKRRLRSLAYTYLPKLGVEGMDYVIIARQRLLTTKFIHLEQDFIKSLAQATEKPNERYTKRARFPQKKHRKTKKSILPQSKKTS